MRSTGHHNGSNGKSHSHNLTRTRRAGREASRKVDRLIGEQYATLNKGVKVVQRSVKGQPVMSIALAFAAGIFTTLLLGAGAKRLD